MVFIDADAFIAIHYSSDAHHKKAIEILNNFEDDLITSSEVVAETTTKLSYFLSHQIACNFINEILKSKIIIEYLNPLRLQQAKELFTKQSSKRVSLTDCINMVICRELGIEKIFSFDKHYEKNGFRLIK